MMTSGKPIQPRVCLIVPIYKTEKYLHKCVDSLLLQTYSNLEILLIDDGSPDNCPKSCDEYKKNDNRVKVIHKENGGVSSARKKGLELCTSPYVMFVDSDDWIELDAIEKCIEAIQADPSIDIIMFPYVREYVNNSLEVHYFNENRRFVSEHAQNVYRRLFGVLGEELRHPEHESSMVTVCMKMYRTEVARKGKFFDMREVGSFEDGLFNMYAMHDCKNIMYLNECLYHYRKQVGGTGRYRENLPNQWARLFEIIETVISEKCLDERYTNALNSRIALSIVGIGLNEINSNYYNFASKIRNIKSYLSREKYAFAVRNQNRKHMPIKWKVFMFFCEKKLAVPVYCLLVIMKKLMGKR